MKFSEWHEGGPNYEEAGNPIEVEIEGKGGEIVRGFANINVEGAIAENCECEDEGAAVEDLGQIVRWRSVYED